MKQKQSVLIYTGLAAVIALVIPFMLSGCGDRVTEQPIEGARLITAERISEGSTASGTSRESRELDTGEQEAGAKIPLEPGQHVLQVLNVNLDIDQDEEQLIVFKRRNDPQDRIHLMVVEFDTVRNGYIATWQGTTGATNVRSFAVLLLDMVGDHQVEIVCSGMNSDGEQTMDVFRKTPSASSAGLHFTSIAAITSDGTIEIMESERSGAYELGQAYGTSYPILTYTTDPASTNIMDLIRTTYYWKYQDNRYILGTVDKVPGRKVEERQLQELYQRGEEPFEAFLKGPWYMESSEGGSVNSGREVILFEPESRKITFYNGEVQEAYDWLSSHKTLYNGLYINSENESIASIKKQISVRALSLDTITLGIAGNDQWEGTYRKLTRELQQSLIADRNGSRNVDLTSLALSGLYRNSAGFEIYFSEPFFTMQSEGKKLAGGYTIYRLQSTVLELKIMRENGLVADTKTYQIEYIEEADASRIARTIVLTPVTIGIRGPEEFRGESIRLEQIEILEEKKPEAESGPVSGPG